MVDKVGAFAEVVAGKLRVGLVEAQKLVVDGVDVGKKLIELSSKSREPAEANRGAEKRAPGAEKLVFSFARPGLVKLD